MKKIIKKSIIIAFFKMTPFNSNINFVSFTWSLVRYYRLYFSKVTAIDGDNWKKKSYNVFVHPIFSCSVVCVWSVFVYSYFGLFVNKVCWSLNMINALTFGPLELDFKPSQTKYLTICTCCFSDKHATFSINKNNILVDKG